MPTVRSHAFDHRLIALVVALVAVASPASAQDDPPPEAGYGYGEFEFPRGAALGGAVRAFSNSLDALYANPANIATTRIYHLGGTAQFSPEAKRSSYGGGVVDSITNRLAGGLGGQYLIQDQNGLVRLGGDVRLALAMPFSDKAFVGLAGRHLWLRQDGEGPLGDSLASGGLEDRNIVKEFSFDAGATLKPTRGLAFSFVGYNLTNPEHAFLPISAGGGVGVGSADFTIEADVLGDFRTWAKSTVRAMGGAELLIADHYPIRLGYRFDQGLESHLVSGGLGYIDRAFSVSVSARRSVSGEPLTSVFLGFEYHLESTDLTPSPAEGF
jgi:opacity protein-like surface antigen